MRTPPPPILYFLVTIITLSSLITKTWGFLLAKPLADKLKLLCGRRHSNFNLSAKVSQKQLIGL